MTQETEINATALARSLSEVLSRVRFGGERFIVQRGGRIVAAVVPAEERARSVTPRELAETMRGLALPADGFADDLEIAQGAQGEPGFPWSN